MKKIIRLELVLMYKTTNSLYKGGIMTTFDFRDIINSSFFCHAVSGGNTEKACGGSRICNYWRIGRSAFF